jgi:hypothetical protein
MIEYALLIGVLFSFLEVCTELYIFSCFLIFKFFFKLDIGVYISYVQPYILRYMSEYFLISVFIFAHGLLRYVLLGFKYWIFQLTLCYSFVHFYVYHHLDGHSFKNFNEVGVRERVNNQRTLSTCMRML